MPLSKAEREEIIERDSITETIEIQTHAIAHHACGTCGARFGDKCILFSKGLVRWGDYYHRAKECIELVNTSKKIKDIRDDIDRHKEQFDIKISNVKRLIDKAQAKRCACAEYEPSECPACLMAKSLFESLELTKPE